MQRIHLQSHERYVGIAGILFILLYALPVLLWGGVRPDEPPAKVASELVSQRGAAVASAYVLLVASVVLLIFCAGITRFTPASPRFSPFLSVFGFGAGAISAALLAVANAVLGALGGYLLTDSAPDTIRSLNALWDAFTTASGLFLGVFAIAVSLLAFEARVLATWMKWLGVGAGVCLIIGAGSLATPFRGVGPFWVLGLLATFIWIASTSVWMLMPKQTTAGISP
jgi:hypothetical protein